MANQRVCAFGYSSMGGPISMLIESSGLDGWLEGPSFGMGLNREALIQLLVRMQTIKRQLMMGESGSGLGQSIRAPLG